MLPVQAYGTVSLGRSDLSPCLLLAVGPLGLEFTNAILNAANILNIN